MDKQYDIEISPFGLKGDLAYVNGVGVIHHLFLHVRLWYGKKMEKFYSVLLDMIDEIEDDEDDEKPQ